MVICLSGILACELSLYVITYKDKSDMLSILGILIAVVSGWACLLFAKKCISALEKCVFREDS